MDNKKLLIIAALVLVVVLVLKRKKNATTLPPEDNEKPADAGNTDGVVSTVDLSELANEMSETDKQAIRDGVDTSWNNIAPASSTR